MRQNIMVEKLKIDLEDGVKRNKNRLCSLFIYCFLYKSKFSNE